MGKIVQFLLEVFKIRKTGEINVKFLFQRTASLSQMFERFLLIVTKKDISPLLSTLPNNGTAYLILAGFAGVVRQRPSISNVGV